MLWQRVIRMFEQGDTPQLYDEVLAAVEELGGRWPGNHPLPDKLNWRYDLSFGQLWWAKLLAAVIHDRKQITSLVTASLWAIRRSATEALASYWPDDDTRRLLSERAVQDDDSDNRSAALEALVKTWPDDDTRRLLLERARVDGAAACPLGKEHSRFGEIVFTRDLNGVGPYLDPRHPLPREHIEKAAERAGVKPEELEKTLRSLSAQLGWDVTVGSEQLSVNSDQ